MREGFAQRATPTTPKTRPAQESELGAHQMFVCCSCVYVTAQLQPIHRHRHSAPLRPSAPPSLRPALCRPSPVHHAAPGEFHSGPVGTVHECSPGVRLPTDSTLSACRVSARVCRPSAFLQALLRPAAGRHHDRARQALPLVRRHSAIATGAPTRSRIPGRLRHAGAGVGLRRGDARGRRRRDRRPAARRAAPSRRA